MRRQKIKIIILVFVLVILMAAVVFMRMPVRSVQENTDVRVEEGAGTKRLVECGAEDFAAGFKEVRVENGKESYSIEMREVACEITDFPENRLDQEKLNLAVEKLMQAEVTQDLGVQEDLMQFGLGEDAPEVTVSRTDRTPSNHVAKSFRIGNMLSGRADECYVLCGGSVCVVQGFPQELCEGRKAFYKLNLISVAPKSDEDGERADRLDYLKLSGSHFENAIRIVLSDMTSSGYLMEEPVYGEAMFEATDAATRKVSILDSLAYVEAASMAYEIADQDIIRECGLDEPYALAKYSLNGEEHVLKVSGVQDGMRYLMADDDPAIYRIEDIKVNAWAEAEVSDLRTSYIWLVDVAKLDALILTGKNGTYEYRIVKQQGDDGQNIKVSCGNKELDVKGKWLPFYQKLLGMTILDTEKPSGWEEEPVYTVSYIYGSQTGKEPVTIEFHREYDKERYAALLNDRFVGILRENTVEEVMELAGKVNADGESR